MRLRDGYRSRFKMKRPECRATIGVVVGFAILVANVARTHRLLNPVGMRERDSLADVKGVEHPDKTDSRKQTRMLSFKPCSDALAFFKNGSLDEAISKNVNFHMLGGNLKSVQKFKDAHIDSTLSSLGI
jgi:hypothetical protein